MNDLRFAFRQLLKTPGFTAVAVLTLALGIGATTAIFSVVYAVVLRPLPFPESERLVALWTQTPQIDRLPMAAANHRDLQSQNTVFEDIAILSRVGSYNLTGDGEPEDVKFKARTGYNHLTVARLKPGVNLEQAQTEVSVIATRLAQEHPRSNKELRFSVTPLRRDIADVARRPLIVLLGAALGLLL